MSSAPPVRKRIAVCGTVQGVGFRPFVYRVATQHALGGWVLNHSGGVDIEVEGADGAVRQFIETLRSDPPPLASIDSIAVTETTPIGEADFTIRPSEAKAGGALPVPPDTAPCAECLAEMRDPQNRRYRYPFINCTNCGPRFTIITALPYDRPNTTMDGFPLCPDCQREYSDPSDRRHHAQPIACPACGPRLWLELDGRVIQEDPIGVAARLLRDGRILAIKGLGGFHLACDARNEESVATLRQRKHRGAKPFAVMFPNLVTLREACRLGRADPGLLSSPRRPIVLVPARSSLAPSVASGLRELGAMLPSTPLHELLLGEFGGPLVMTSGNLSEEPIAAENDEARDRLGSLADGFLLHDRPIASRYDDSVACVVEDQPVLVRRARSWAPEPIRVPFTAERSVLAVGAHLKNTFCFLKGRHALLSQHIGDLENVETLRHYRATVELYERLFAVRPELVAHDLHPGYLSTQFALGLEGVQRLPVQHHHAHIVSCLIENGLDATAIGVAYDGLGYGTDGHLWGGEILVADYVGFERRAHLREAPMPGGEAAIRKPYRMALGYLSAWFPGELSHFESFLDSIDPREISLIQKQIERGLNTPLTSSCGRLFDAMAALLGVRGIALYEGQAAMELQALADQSARGTYPYELALQDRTWVIDPAPMMWAAYADHRDGVPVSTVAMRVHRTVADFTVSVCQRLADETGLRLVALSGGVFQNTLLLAHVLRGLRAVHLQPYFHHRVPSNDGGLSLGQAVIADAQMHRRARREQAALDPHERGGRQCA
jgi:hydrogenase maturation protein HypF